MPNFLGLFTRGFLLYLQACFNIVYLGYIICENAYLIPSYNYCESQPKSTATKLFRDFIYAESLNYIGWNLYEQRYLVKINQKMLMAKSTVKFVKFTKIIG